MFKSLGDSHRKMWDMWCNVKSERDLLKKKRADQPANQEKKHRRTGKQHEATEAATSMYFQVPHRSTKEPFSVVLGGQMQGGSMRHRQWCAVGWGCSRNSYYKKRCLLFQSMSDFKKFSKEKFFSVETSNFSMSLCNGRFSLTSLETLAQRAGRTVDFPAGTKLLVPTYLDTLC